MKVGDRVFIKSRGQVGYLFDISEEYGMCGVAWPKMNSKNHKYVPISAVEDDIKVLLSPQYLNGSQIVLYFINHEHAKIFLSICAENGYHWNGGTRATNHIPNASEFCINVEGRRLMWCSRDFYENRGYVIVDFEECFMKKGGLYGGQE